MTAPDWLLPARSIPVWVGARVLYRFSEDGGPPLGGWLARTSDEPGGPATMVGGGRIYTLAGTLWIAPDLSNPDTFAAARDRLALRMGAPPDHVAVGTKVYAGTCYGRARVIVSAGESYVDDGHHRKSMYPWEKTIELDVWPATRELALALAWQQVAGA